MKRIILAVVILAFHGQSLYAQNAYNDALVLNKKYVKPANTVILLDIEAQQLLAKYYPDKTPDDMTAVFLNANPFFKDLFNDRNNQNQDNSSFVSKTFSLSRLGDLDVTNLADGVAKFLVERAKEELSLAFFEKLKSDMAEDRWKELRILFPQTYATLQLIDTRIYQYAAYLTELREAFIVDLKDLGYNVPTMLRSPGKIGDYFNSHPEFRTVVSFIGQVTDLFVHEDKINHAGLMIEQLAPDHYFSSADPSDVLMNGSIKLLQLLSASLKSGDSTRYWVPVDSLTAFFGDAHTARLYLGLIYTKSDGIVFANGKTFKAMLDGLAANFNTRVVPFSQAIGSWTTAIGSYDAYWKYKKQPKNADSTAMYYYSMYTKSIDAISDGLGLVKVFDTAFAPGFEKFLPPMRTLGDVYIDAQQKKFSLSILSLVKFLGQIKDAGYDSRLLERLATYGAFVAEVAQAENSTQVKDIIEQTVLPVGSASIKKESRFNISLNAYLGGFFGNEFMPDNGRKHWAMTSGVSAPIGVAFSKPLIFNNGKCKLGSISGFISLFDLGAVASFRFKDSTTEKLPRLNLQNIFAPGAGVIWGVPKWPVSIGYLYQWGPALREITATDANLNTGGLNRRWLFFAAVDIPLLNIFNRPR